MLKNILFLGCLFCLPVSARTFYVDCTSGSDASTGVSEVTGWRTLERVSSTEFSPGDNILLKRGTRCTGQLSPKGSGDEGHPIRLGAFGTGPLPVVDAASAESAIKLFNQHDWIVETIHTIGGSPYGIFVSGNQGELPRITLRNLVVHGVTGEPKTKKSGLVSVTTSGPAHMSDVLIDGVTAYDSTQWAGIIVSGASRENRIRNVTVRNSIVHDLYGDGIVLFSVEDGLIEKSAAWRTGLQPVEKIGTPNAIWTWTCRRCTVRQTEGFFIDSPGVDGGVYDIDWGNDDNVVEDNYAHDSQGYCAAVFGSGKQTTTNSIIRNNLCVDNGRSPKLARRQGDLYISTWEGGLLDGVRIENNTFYWNPPIDTPAIQMDQADFTGNRTNVMRGNTIYTGVSSAVHLSNAINQDANRIGRAGQSINAACPPAGRFRLVATGAGRDQVVFLQAALAQYPGRLEAQLVLSDAAPNLQHDWNLGAVTLQSASRRQGLEFYSPDNRLIARWEGFASPTTLGAALRKALGVPNPFAAALSR